MAIGVAEQIVPQLAYATMQQLLQQVRQFVMRVVPKIADLFHSLEMMIQKRFFQKLVGSAITSDLREYSTVPIKMGGCSIPNPRL
jgi:hypothetical protein